MASPSTCAFTDGLLCPVCCEEIKTPKMIPCGHSFCLVPCLKDLLKTSPICPLCRKDIPAPSSGLAEDFPTNFALQALCGSGMSENFQIPNVEEVYEPQEPECRLHNNKQTFLCETCSSLLCEECRSSHDQGHKIDEVKTVAERKIKELEPIMDEVSKAEASIRAYREAIREAKKRCEQSSKQAKTDIGLAVSSAINLLRKKEEALYNEVDWAKTASMKEIKGTETQTIDLELTARHTKFMGESLIRRFKKHDLEDDGTMEALLERQSIIKDEMENLKKKLDGDKTATSFASDVPSDITIGHVKYDNKKLIHATPIQLRSFTGKYIGYVWFSLNDLYMITSREGRRLEFVSVSDASRNQLETVFVPTEADSIDSMKINPHVGENGLSLLFNDYINVFKITVNLITGKTVIRKKTIKNKQVYEIMAVSWDAAREGCYVLLQDFLSINHLSLNGRYTDKKYVQLEHQVVCSSSNGFHISEFGGMAICDENRRTIEYFTKIQPCVSEVIQAPEPIAGASPSYLTSRGSDQKWFVNWRAHTSLPGYPNNPFHITQYSNSFQLEKYVLSGYGIASFHFLDEEYFLTSNNQRSQLTVHRIATVEKLY